MKVVIAERRVNGDFLLTPYRGLAIPNLPVFFVITIKDDVPAEQDKRGSGFSNCLHQRLAHSRIRRFSVRRVMKAGISISDEIKWCAQLEPYFRRLSWCQRRPRCL